MIPRFFHLNTFTRDDRNEMINRANQVISKSGGWLLDHKMFSNKTINLIFEIAQGNLGNLLPSLEESKFKIIDESRVLLKSFAQDVMQLKPEALDKTVIGTLQVTFMHNDPDMRIENPPIPG